jgi:hypothetical protein
MRENEMKLWRTTVMTMLSLACTGYAHGIEPQGNIEPKRYIEKQVTMNLHLLTSKN